MTLPPMIARLLTARVSLRRKVLAVVFLAALLPAAFVSLPVASISTAALREAIMARQNATVDRLVDRINAHLERHRSLLGEARTITALPRTRQTAALKTLMEKGEAFREIIITDRGGRAIVRYPPAALTPGSDKAKTSFGRGVVRSDFVSGVRFSPEHEPYMLISAPLVHGSGALVGRLDFERVWQWTASVQMGRSGEAFIVDKQGALIAHRETERVLARSDYSGIPVVRDFIDGRTPSPRRWSAYRDERGRRVIALYRTIPWLGWAVIAQMGEREAFAPVRTMLAAIGLWTLVFTGLFLWAGYRVVRAILTPVARLKEGAAAITAGRLDIRLDIHTGDELEDLAHSFEHMADALKALETLKQDLTRMIIHDLKGPMTGIMGTLDYLGAGLGGVLSEQQRSSIAIALESSEKLLAMIQNLLDVARMEEGKLTLRKETLDIAHMLCSCRDKYLQLAVKEGKTIDIDLPEEPLSSLADENLIERVLSNLVTNALQHTSTGSRIVLSAGARGKLITIHVADNGPGIPPEFRKRIFEKFVQVERREKRLRTGAGLGLTFCRMAVEAHGGTIRVEDAPGGGSIFKFTLPLIRTMASAAPVAAGTAPAPSRPSPSAPELPGL